LLEEALHSFSPLLEFAEEYVEEHQKMGQILIAVAIFDNLGWPCFHDQVFPLFAALGLGVGACVYSSMRNFLHSPDVK
jgi:Kef-type K+ transport system membrane component KefB